MFKQSLRQRTEKALGVFRSTVENLALVNLEADKECEALEIQISDLEAKRNDLESLKSENERVIEKITKFLED